MDSKHLRAMAIFHTTNSNLLADAVLRYWGETLSTLLTLSKHICFYKN